MPASFVHGPEEERHWSMAKEAAASEGHEKDWPYVTGIYERMQTHIGGKKKPKRPWRGKPGGPKTFAKGFTMQFIVKARTPIKGGKNVLGTDKRGRGHWRKPIKEMLKDPAQRKDLVEGATRGVVAVGRDNTHVVKERDAYGEYEVKHRPAKEEHECRWFAGCHNEATGIEPHPAFPQGVPICDRCRDWLKRVR